MNHSSIRHDYFHLPKNEIVRVFVPTLYFVVGALIIIINGLVVTAFLSDRKLRKPAAGMYMLSMTSGDLFSGFMLLIYTRFYVMRTRNEVSCIFARISVYGLQICLINTVITMIAIAVDRHRAIVQVWKAPFSRKTTFIAIIVIWCVALVAKLPGTLNDFGYGETKWPKEPQCHESMCFANSEIVSRVGITIFFAVTLYLCPMAIIFTIYTKVTRALQFQPDTDADHSFVSKDDAKREARRKTVVMMLVMVGSFFAFWFPFVAFRIVTVLPLDRIPPCLADKLDPVFYVITTLHCVSNSFIHFFYVKRIRRAIITLILLPFRVSPRRHRTLSFKLQTVSHSHRRPVRKPAGGENEQSTLSHFPSIEFLS